MEQDLSNLKICSKFCKDFDTLFEKIEFEDFNHGTELTEGYFTCENK